MSDSVDPMNPTEPLGQLPKPVTVDPVAGQGGARSGSRQPPRVLQKIRTSHPRSSRIPDADVSP